MSLPSPHGPAVKLSSPRRRAIACSVATTTKKMRKRTRGSATPPLASSSARPSLISSPTSPRQPSPSPLSVSHQAPTPQPGRRRAKSRPRLLRKYSRRERNRCAISSNYKVTFISQLNVLEFRFEADQLHR